MDIEIIYSLKEYQEKYTSSLDKYLLEYEEVEKIDFVNYEIEKYNICLRIINFPIRSAFNIFFRIESKWMDLEAYSLTQEVLDFIFSGENDTYYFKMYHDLIGSNNITSSDCEKKIIQTRLIFPKIISFLESKKAELLQSKSVNPNTKDLMEKNIEIANSQSKSKFEITLKHLALKAHYERKIISESNASEFLVNTGLKSGKKLSQLYSFYNKRANRLGDPQSKVMLDNKIKLFMEVTTLLTEDLRGRVIDEIKILESFIPLY